MSKERDNRIRIEALLHAGHSIGSIAKDLNVARSIVKATKCPLVKALIVDQEVVPSQKWTQRQSEQQQRQPRGAILTPKIPSEHLQCCKGLLNNLKSAPAEWIRTNEVSIGVEKEVTTALSPP